MSTEREAVPPMPDRGDRNGLVQRGGVKLPPPGAAPFAHLDNRSARDLGLTAKVRRRPRWPWIAGAVAVLASTAVAYLLFAGSARTPVDALRPGDCVDPVAAEVPTAIDVVACDRPHGAQVVAVLKHPAAAGEPFPGRPEAVVIGERLCAGTLAESLGPIEALGADGLAVAMAVPTESAWGAGERLIVCQVVGADAKPLTQAIRTRS